MPVYAKHPLFARASPWSFDGLTELPVCYLLRRPPGRERRLELAPALRRHLERVFPRVPAAQAANPAAPLEQRGAACQRRALQPEDIGQFADRRRTLQREAGEDRKLRRSQPVRTQLLFVHPGNRPRGAPGRQAPAVPRCCKIDV